MMPSAAQQTDPFKKKGLSTSGVTILPSMDAQGISKKDLPDPLSIHDRPGFKRCTFVRDFIQTAAGAVPVITHGWRTDDFFSTLIVRCGIQRHQYAISPGLYAIGKPDEKSDVLVTANFKLTFDHLRKVLRNVNAWILVLDTKGVNVWCAAGKGTFSTQELVKRIKAVSLEKIVGHRRLILPQLSATGVSAKTVKKQSGFQVIFGPVRAKDIPAFLKNNRTADPGMRQVTFDLYDRFILTPVEIQIILKPALITALVVLLLSGIGPEIFSLSSAWEKGRIGLLALASGIVSGAVFTPVLLPYIPVKAFALKGLIIGAPSAFITLLLAPSSSVGASGTAALFLFSITVSSFLAMNFTGSTPFTSPSGVEKEMKHYIPVQLATLLLSFGLWMYSAF